MINLLISNPNIDTLVQKCLLLTIGPCVSFDTLLTIRAASPLAYLRYGKSRVISGLVDVAVEAQASPFVLAIEGL